MSTQSYYSMVAVNVSSTYKIVIDKSKVTNNFTISAFNHFSEA